MSSDPNQIKAIFLEAVDQPSPEACSDYLHHACEDSEVRRQVEVLLEAHRQAGSFLRQDLVAPGVTIDQGMESKPGQDIGPYRLLQQIGEGGMGVVFMADQTHPIKRRVALKVVKPRMDSKEVIARFEAERQALALMDHPNIAKVFDVGTTDLGRPYFVMELVRGVPITQYCQEHRIKIPERLQLFRSVCQAVQHAHQKGVIHRDIKPSNILVAEYDDIAVPKVIDFGLAKALQHSLTEKTLFTQFGQVAGTPAYMSPEQAKLNQLDIDTRTDIYSLGVLLYELLTGSTPFDPKTLREAALDEMLRMIREVEPPRPSAKLTGDPQSTVAAASCRTEPKKLRTLLMGDLDAIVMKAMDKNRSRRYESSAAFAEDIQCYLTGERVSASPPTSLDHLERFIRRNRAAIVRASSVLLVITIISVFAVSRVHRAQTARRHDLVQSLFRVESDQIPNVLSELDRQGARNDSEFRERYESSQPDSPEKLRAALALLPIDGEVADDLQGRLLNAEVDEFALVLEHLKEHGGTDLTVLRQIVTDDSARTEDRFRAACSLASLDVGGSSWSDDITSDLARHLVQTAPEEKWHLFLEPIGRELLAPLAEIYRDKSSRADEARNAALALREFLKNQPETLFDHLVDARTPELLAVMFPSLDDNAEQFVEFAASEIQLPLSLTSDESTNESASRRQANAAIVLLAQGQKEAVRPLLRHSENPTVRSFFIHFLSASLDDPQSLVDWYHDEDDISIKRALLFALGEYDGRALVSIDRLQLIDQLFTDYRTHPDAGLHGATEWLLRAWGQGARIAQVDEELAGSNSASNRNLDWYVSSLGQTFVILEADEFTLIAPGTSEETRTGRRFAICTKEVTKEHFFEFEKDFDPDLDLNWFPEPDCPMGWITWYKAAEYCNWLSEQDGIPAEQWCFEPNDNGEYAAGMKAKSNFLELAGYRLPTEAEWEFACRAGTVTRRYFGEGPDLLAHYAWFTKNSTSRSDLLQSSPVGTRKPNDFGLFDMHGNIYEWCLDKYPRELDSSGADRPDVSNIGTLPRRILRGGSFENRDTATNSYFPGRRPLDVNSALHGVRVVRTYPR